MEVLLAANAEEELRFSQSRDFDVYLLDSWLPDIDGYEPGVMKQASLDDFECEACGRAHFGCEVLHPEVHDEQHDESGARDPLQVPIDGSSSHI